MIHITVIACHYPNRRCIARFDYLILPFLVLLISGCTPSIKSNVSDFTYVPSRDTSSDIIQLVNAIPNNASIGNLHEHLRIVLPVAGSTPVGRLDEIYLASEKLSMQPNLVEAVANLYRDLPPENFVDRIVLISILGNAKRLDSVPFLESIITASLPPEEAAYLTLSDRQRAELVMEKAVQAVAFLRVTETFKLVKGVALKHESHYVRIAAIDAFTWNKDDSIEAQTELKEILPQSMHCYISRPRFTATVRSDSFNAAMQDWLTHCGR